MAAPCFLAWRSRRAREDKSCAAHRTVAIRGGGSISARANLACRSFLAAIDTAGVAVNVNEDDSRRIPTRTYPFASDREGVVRIRTVIPSCFVGVWFPMRSALAIVCNSIVSIVLLNSTSSCASTEECVSIKLLIVARTVFPVAIPVASLLDISG